MKPALVENMRPFSVSIVNRDVRRMGKGAAVLLVTLTCVALLLECQSQGEVVLYHLLHLFPMHASCQ